jgi:ParB family chromosome partitioning protein
MASIKKTDMASRVAKAAEATPDLEARLRHAQDLAHAHPAGDTPLVPNSAPLRESSITSSHEARFVAAPIDLVDPNPFNARKIYRPERVNELAASIGAHGQDVPGIATMRNGRYVLAAGHYRMRAIKVCGLNTMNLMLHEGLTDKELYEYSYRENAEREGQSALDNALCWRNLLDLKLYASETELSETTGISLSNINKTLRILKLSDEILDVVKEDPAVFALTALYELALYEAAAGTKEAFAMARLIKDGEAGRKEVQEARAKVENHKERKRKETSRAYKIQRGGASIGSVKVWDSGRIMLDVVLTDDSDRDSVLSELKELFGVTG